VVNYHGKKFYNIGPGDSASLITYDTLLQVRIDGGLAMRKAFARGLAEALVNFFNLHYQP
jgi:hypothetical protein